MSEHWYMGDASAKLRELRSDGTVQLSRRVDNAQAGFMGAVEVTHWRTSDGEVYRYEASNGGDGLFREQSPPTLGAGKWQWVGE